MKCKDCQYYHSFAQFYEDNEECDEECFESGICVKEENTHIFVKGIDDCQLNKENKNRLN